MGLLHGTVVQRQVSVMAGLQLLPCLQAGHGPGGLCHSLGVELHLSDPALAEVDEGEASVNPKGPRDGLSYWC